MTTQGKNTKSSTKNTAQDHGNAFDFATPFGAAPELAAQVQANADAALQSLALAGKGAEEITAQMMTYAKTNGENYMAAMQGLAGANSVQDMMTVQADYAQSVFAAASSQLSALSALGFGAMKAAAAPINERIAASVNHAQGLK